MAFFSTCLGKPLLAIEKKKLCGPQVSRVVHTLDAKDLLERGMVERRDLPVAFVPTGGPVRGQTNRPDAGWKGVAAMADLHRPHDSPDSANHPKVKPNDFRITPQAASEWRWEFEAAMDWIEEVAMPLGADAEKMERVQCITARRARFNAIGGPVDKLEA